MAHLRIALAQVNTVVGALDANRALVLQSTRTAHAQGAGLVVFPEMTLTGYSVEDLALLDPFVRAASGVPTVLARELAEAGLGETVVIVGGIGIVTDAGSAAARGAASELPRTSISARPSNRAFVLHRGVVLAEYDKQRLPESGVFDEARTFTAGTSPCVLEIAGLRVGLAICEDLWPSAAGSPDLGSALDVLVSLNASPFQVGKAAVRARMVADQSARLGVPVAYVNLVGGQDELVFDGGSFITGPDGAVLARAAQFEPEILTYDVGSGSPAAPAAPATPLAPVLEGDAEVYHAIVTGLRDYVAKNGFRSVILGMSGGIDSALLAVIAADAIGGAGVVGVSMPSSFSSAHSKDDAHDLATRIGADLRVEPIAEMVEIFEKQLGLTGIAQENLQARVRGVILMGLSNQEGHLVLAPGNKSELAVGYSTIYGDAVGGFGPLKDVLKSQVWALARWRNNQALDAGLIPPIPESSITKPPSAELRPGQVDQDSLPPYDVLDAILAGYVEKRLGRAELIAQGFDADVVQKVATLVDHAEWKRRQYPIGPKVSALAFGRDRRLPITNKWS